jgi:hypothetical protein
MTASSYSSTSAPKPSDVGPGDDVLATASQAWWQLGNAAATLCGNARARVFAVMARAMPAASSVMLARRNVEQHRDATPHSTPDRTIDDVVGQAVDRHPDPWCGYAIARQDDLQAQRVHRQAARASGARRAPILLRPLALPFPQYGWMSTVRKRRA